MLANGLQKAAGFVLALALISSLVPCVSALQPARADELSDLEALVKESAATYNSAVARQEELAAEIEELDGKIDELEKLLPKQQERSDTSYRALYKYSQDTSSMVSLVLGSESLSDMLALVDAYQWVIDYNVGEIEKTTKMRTDLEESRSKVEDDKKEADAQAAAAEASLTEAKQAREAAQQRALEAQRAEEEARKAEAAQKQQEAAAKVESASTEEEKLQAKAEQKQVEEEVQEAEEAESAASSGNVDWDSDKTAFVNKWAPRIDAYLEGSPTAGTGKYYAAAAWDNGVDPRWAPAISLVESGKGEACFASHNAWGYGGVGFGSWQEGIEEVVSSLGSSLYGGYLTKEAAKTYCPPTWQQWYNECAEQMAMI